MKKALLFITMLMVIVTLAYAQQRQVTGKVVGEDGAPVPFVSVQIKGTTSGTAADQNGFFKLNNVEQDAVLIFRAVGYLQQEVSIGKLRELTITMVVSSNTLDEVVIGAGGVQNRKREVGYNSTIVNNVMITQAKPLNVAAGLSGKVAGLQVNAVSSGVNPTVRITLRGNRSLLGNNQALIVIDNVIVPNDVLSNLNPEDVEDINVLNGAGAAALYGSDASNGAIIVTTKKGKSGVNSVRLSNTTTLEQVSFYPKLQTSFGSGSANDMNIYTPWENQQYGPAFDGSMKQIGRPLLDGRTQSVPYSATNDKKKFWETGVNNQTDLSVSSGDDKTTTYFAAQYVTVQGTTPKDEYNRFSLRANGSRVLSPKFKVDYKVNYVQNRYDITNATAAMYEYLLNTPAQIPLTKYKDWQNDPFANPMGYYNDYYPNPYFHIDNNRSNVRNDYMIGSAELRYFPVENMQVLWRAGVTTRNTSSKDHTGRFIYLDYYHTGSKTDIPGSVSDASSYGTQLVSDLQIEYEKKVQDFSFRGLVGGSIRNNTAKSVGVSATGLVNPGLYNISNTVALKPDGNEANFTERQMGLYGQLKVGYKNYAFVEITGRNDWRSVLDPANWSFFYPSVNVSFIPTEAFSSLQGHIVSNLKLRGGWSQVGNVTIGPYSLIPTFSQARGYPYSTGPGYTADNRIVSPGLEPEMTTQVEAGFDADFWESRINTGFTVYSSRTKNQTVPTGVSTASGFSSYLRNTGEVSNKGVEAMLHITPLKTRDWTLTVGGNYTYNDNKVLSISSDLDRLQLSTGGDAQIYAIKGMDFPVVMGTDYLRDPQGRVIVDAKTGYPSKDETIKVLGNTQPKVRLGLDLELRYKNFRLWALFDHRADYVINMFNGGTFDFSGSSIRTVAFNRERFVMPNSSYENPDKPGEYLPNTNITVRDGGAGFWADGAGDYNTNIATNYTYSGNFWKMREASLSYDLPGSLLTRIKLIKSASISIQGRNLFLWTPKTNIYTDPEYNFSDSNAIGLTTLGQTPPSRYFGGSISLTF